MIIVDTLDFSRATFPPAHLHPHLSMSLTVLHTHIIRHSHHTRYASI